MNKDQSLQVIEQALNLAAKAGVFNIQDASTINVAFTIIKNEFKDQSEEEVKQLKTK